MNAQWSKLWTRRPRLSRGGKLAVNLILTALLLVYAWGLADYPLPTAELEFRRLERASLEGPSDLQGIFSRGSGLGVAGDWVLVWQGDRLARWPRAEAGAVLVPQPCYTGPSGEARVAAADVPEGTASARLTLHVRCWYARSQDGESTATQHQAAEHPLGGWRGGPPQRWEETYTVPGERAKEGAFLFRIPQKHQGEELDALERSLLIDVGEWSSYRKPEAYRAADLAMEAVFYDAAGNETGRAALSTPD